MSLAQFDAEFEQEQEAYDLIFEQEDIRKSKAMLRQSNDRQKNRKTSNSEVKSGEFGIFQPNPEDVWSSQDHQEAIRLIQLFAAASKSMKEGQPIYTEVKEYCKTRKNRQLLILNGNKSNAKRHSIIIKGNFHLYLREAYKAGHERQQTVLEIIYQISLEKDFCDEVALLGEMIDEAFVFLQTHLKTYNRLDVKDYLQEQNEMLQFDIEIIDSATLLKLDLWIRILVNFCKNEEVLQYVVANKEDVVKYLLLFLQNIDQVIQKNSNLSSINSLIIASSIKTGVLETLYLLTQIDEMRKRIIFNASYFTAIYLDLLKNTTNPTMFSSLCRLMSQLALCEKFPIHIWGLNLVEDFLLNYMMMTIYNVGMNPGDEHVNWENMQQERQQRGNFLVEQGLARTFFALTLHSLQRKVLMKSIKIFEDNVIVRFLLACHQLNLIEAQIQLILGLTQLFEKESFSELQQYQRKQLRMFDFY